MRNRKPSIIGSLVGIVLIGGFVVYRVGFHTVPRSATSKFTATTVRNATNSTSGTNSQKEAKPAVSNNVVITPISPEATKKANQIDAAVQSLLNQPHSKAMDASGFVQYVYSSVGVTLPRTIDAQATIGKQINNPQLLQDGDLVFFNLANGQPTATFEGVYLGNHQFAALTTHGIMSISLNDPYWKSKFLYGRHIAGA